MPSPILETDEAAADDDDNAPYVSFTGTPIGNLATEMEATVASLVFESEANEVLPERENITSWMDFGAPIPAGARMCKSGHRRCRLTADASAADIEAIINRGGLSDESHTSLVCVLSSIRDDEYSRRIDESVQFGLRADSEGAPETHAEALARGEPWPSAIATEFNNHRNNKSWEMVPRSSVPRGRRIHKFVWVFKQKRDGTAKARLCVQGCTLEEGIDYDQTFAKPLRHTSARGLFAYAARHGCHVRSIDFVAAYLQGDFMDGEVVYCKQPAGSNVIGPDGLPMICMVVKPIYGIPQAGRRLQRKIFPWCVDVMGLRQLDDSDDCVFVWDDPEGKEHFAMLGHIRR